MKINKKYSKGFTLVELLLVIAIIAILATVLFVSLGGQRERARTTAFKENMRGLVTTYTACADGSGTIQGTMGADACSATALGLGKVPVVPNCNGTNNASITIPTDNKSGDHWKFTGDCTKSDTTHCYAVCNADGCVFCNNSDGSTACGTAATSCQ